MDKMQKLNSALQEFVDYANNTAELDKEDLKMTKSAKTEKKENSICERVVSVKLERIDNLIKKYKSQRKSENKVQILTPSKINQKYLREKKIKEDELARTSKLKNIMATDLTFSKKESQNKAQSCLSKRKGITDQSSTDTEVLDIDRKSPKTQKWKQTQNCSNNENNSKKISHELNTKSVTCSKSTNKRKTRNCQSNKYYATPFLRKRRRKLKLTEYCCVTCSEVTNTCSSDSRKRKQKKRNRRQNRTPHRVSDHVGSNKNRQKLRKNNKSFPDENVQSMNDNKTIVIKTESANVCKSTSRYKNTKERQKQIHYLSPTSNRNNIDAEATSNKEERRNVNIKGTISSTITVIVNQEEEENKSTDFSDNQLIANDTGCDQNTKECKNTNTNSISKKTECDSKQNHPNDSCKKTRKTEDVVSVRTTHQEKQSPKKVLIMCNACMKMHNIMEDLKIKRNTISSKILPVQCPFCTLHFISLLYLQQHITDTHLQCKNKLSVNVDKFAIKVICPEVNCKSSGLSEADSTSAEEPTKGTKRSKEYICNFNFQKRLKIDDRTQLPYRNSKESKTKQEFSKRSSEDANNNKSNEEVVTSTTNEIVCKLCDKELNSQTAFTEHISFCQNVVVQDAGVSYSLRPYLDNSEDIKNACTYQVEQISEEECSSNFLVREDTRSLNGLCEETNSKIDCKITDTMKIRKQWHCKACSNTFQTIHKFLHHQYYVHNNDSVVHVCENCGKVLTSVTMANVHVCTNVNKWICKRCNIHFPNGMSLRDHNTNEHFETVGPHLCDVCSKKFLTLSMLERHQEFDCLHESKNLDVSSYDNIWNEEERSDFTPNSWKLSEFEVKHLPNEKQRYKCDVCDVICLTRTEIKVHSMKHNVTTEICEFCNTLYTADAITRHLFYKHLDGSLSHRSTAEFENSRTPKEVTEDLFAILKPKHFLSLCEYRKFDDISEHQNVRCAICSHKFPNRHYYRIHYLKMHDTVCIFCGMEFENSNEAVTHKIKIHCTTDLYLWTVKKLCAAALQLKKHGETVEDTM